MNFGPPGNIHLVAGKTPRHREKYNFHLISNINCKEPDGTRYEKWFCKSKCIVRVYCGPTGLKMEYLTTQRYLIVSIDRDMGILCTQYELKGEARLTNYSQKVQVKELISNCRGV